MNRSVFGILALGLFVGTAVHFAYYRLSLRSTVPLTLDGELSWIRDEVHLTDAQFARIKQIHESSSPELRTLAAQVSDMQRELAEFENTRRTTDQVDFLEFARFVESRRSLDRRCSDSTQRIIAASADVMTPAQRQRYFGLLKSMLPLSVQISTH
jgi:hypothetical protein